MGGCGPVHAVKLEERGLDRFFGELEARIMEAVWALEEATVHDICEYLGADCHYKTIMTVASRLVQKGALKRRRPGRAYVYAPVAPRDKFLQNILSETVTGLMQDFGSDALVGFAAAVDGMAPEQLEKLREMVETRLEMMRVETEVDGGVG